MKKIILLTILLGMLLLSPVVSAGLGDEDDNRVIISVKYQKEGPFGGSTIESPIEGARVEIKEGIETIIVGVTDQYGIYELYLEDGDYTIGITAEGFEPYTYELNDVGQDVSVPIILVMITPFLLYVCIFLVAAVIAIVLILKYKDSKRKKGKKKEKKK